MKKITNLIHNYYNKNHLKAFLAKKYSHFITRIKTHTLQESCEIRLKVIHTRDLLFCRFLFVLKTIINIKKCLFLNIFQILVEIYVSIARFTYLSMYVNTKVKIS